MFSIRADLEEKRQKAIKDLCGEELEKLFMRFTNVIYYRCEPLDVIEKRNVIINVTKDFDSSTKVAIYSRFKGTEMISAREKFKNIDIGTMKKILIYILEKENFKYEIISTNFDNVKIIFEI